MTLLRVNRGLSKVVKLLGSGWAGKDRLILEKGSHTT